MWRESVADQVADGMPACTADCSTAKPKNVQDQTVTVLVSDITLVIELDDQESASRAAPPPGPSLTLRQTDRGRSPEFPSEGQPSAETDPSRINRDTARIRVMTPRRSAGSASSRSLAGSAGSAAVASVPRSAAPGSSPRTSPVWTDQPDWLRCCLIG